MEYITTTYLEMTSPLALKEKSPAPGLVIIESEVKQFQFNRFLYALVGEAWRWTDKLSWSDAQWETYICDPNLRTWVAYFKGTPAGYYELQQQLDGDVEIAYFGLAPAFIGKGFGGYLLSDAIRTAWNMPQTQRVWVHTCNLDHPAALSNYQERGMKVYKVETMT
jgi:GNAT superfamily N-acetyltransferase